MFFSRVLSNHFCYPDILEIVDAIFYLHEHIMACIFAVEFAKIVISVIDIVKVGLHVCKVFGRKDILFSCY